MLVDKVHLCDFKCLQFGNYSFCTSFRARQRQIFGSNTMMLITCCAQKQWNRCGIYGKSLATKSIKTGDGKYFNLFFNILELNMALPQSVQYWILRILGPGTWWNHFSWERRWNTFISSLAMNLFSTWTSGCLTRKVIHFLFMIIKMLVC